ncbi:MAG: hypothetical protein Q9163_000801 [Psora crenata]
MTQSFGNPKSLAQGGPSADNAPQKNCSLDLLDLPLDILKAILKEIPHTNDLTALALTHSSLHGLVTPLIYSRFDIVWPDALNMTEPRTGVDALTYGLATLVMREDIFENAMLQPRDPRHGTCQSYACKGCGNINYVNKAKPARAGRLRRGNFFSQFTKKFSLGNGPPDLVQEYLVTKESGKMLGTLVALSIARMPNLETFIWDMPTGILRDIWISLSSLGDYQPSKLRKVFVRFHNNSKALESTGLVRSSSTGNQQPLPTSTPSQTGPQLPFSSTNPMATKLMFTNNHVESPNFSILPPLQSIGAIAVDELANLNELSILVKRSVDSLRELKVGMASDVHTSGLPLDRGPVELMRNGGALALLFNGLLESWPKSSLETPTQLVQSTPITRPTLSAQEAHSMPGSAAEATAFVSTSTASPPAKAAGPKYPIPDFDTANIDPALTQSSVSEADHRDKSLQEDQLPSSGEQNLVLRPSPSNGVPSSPSKEGQISAYAPKTGDTSSGLSSAVPPHKRLTLDTLELERQTLNIHVLRRAIDWSCLTSLTLLQCVDTDALWSALRTQYAPVTRSKSLLLSIPTVSLDKKNGPHPRLRRMPPSPHTSAQPQPIYRMNLKHLHTNTVSASLLTFLKGTLAPNTLQSLFLQDHQDYLSAISISQIFRGILKRHRGSLVKVLLDSSHGVVNSRTRSLSARKWMLNREILMHITSPGKLPKLRELSVSLEYKDWHFFLQQLPNVRGLRSLHIPSIADHVYGSNLGLRELAMGVIDVINVRQECQLAYLGVGGKCFEVVEKRVKKERKPVSGGAANGQSMDDSSSEAPSVNDESEANDNDDGDDDDDDDHDGSDDDHHGAGHGTGPAPATATNAVEEDEAAAAWDDDVSSDEDDGTRAGKQVKMRLREILFYDDKISIFKARHGKL